MRAIITPRGPGGWLPPFNAPLTDEPVYASDAFGGYATATIPCHLTPAQLDGIRMAKVDIFGVDGPVWTGLAWERPKTGDSLSVLGWACVTSLGHARAYHAHQTGFLATVNQILAYDITAANPWALPSGSAYTAWVGAPSGLVESQWSATSLPIDKLKDICAYNAWNFGWYNERIGGAWVPVPHYYARPSTPSYLVRAQELAANELTEVSVEQMASAVVVSWTDTSGNAQVNTYTDSDPTHYLNQIGVYKVETVSSSVSDSTAAATVGAAYLADAGRDQLAGTITTPVIRDIGGGVIPLSSVRPGYTMRVTGLSRPIDVVVRNIECTGESSAVVTCDNRPWKVETALAKAAR